MGEGKPSWTLVGVGCLAGVIGGALLWLVAETSVIFLLDQLFGRSGWQESVRIAPEPARIALLLIRWTIVGILGQWFATWFSGWTKTAYFAAALQTLHLINIYWDLQFLWLWALPALVALAYVRTNWAVHAAEKGRAAALEKASARGSR